MSAVKLVTRAKKVVQEHDVELTGEGINVILHPQNVRVDIPEALEINAIDTINCIKNLNEEQWEWISKGTLFRIAYRFAMKDVDPEPPDFEDLKMGDMGVQHLCGMIILACEAMFARKKNIFIRNPETYLHPVVERCVMYSFKAMLELTGNGSGVVTKTKSKGGAEDEESWFQKELKETIREVEGTPPKPKKTKGKKSDAEDAATEDEEKLRITLLYLNNKAKHKGNDAAIAKIGDTVISIGQMIEEVKNNSDIGKSMIEQYFKLYNTVENENQKEQNKENG
jgi:hypothetical protein